ncbi:MAG: leucine-rich repeat domain-containing protein, partial [Alphaproteobacteria bacterium]|nr:leucine-rich repeat domain-containing protein [Alphaproteobacteria bacterium]
DGREEPVKRRRLNSDIESVSISEEPISHYSEASQNLEGNVSADHPICYLDELPAELIVHIAHFLPTDDQKEFSLMSKNIHASLLPKEVVYRENSAVLLKKEIEIAARKGFFENHNALKLKLEIKPQTEKEWNALGKKFPYIKELHINDIPLSKNDLISLCKSFYNLRLLSLQKCLIDAEGLAVITESENMKNLETLHIVGNSMSAVGNNIIRAECAKIIASSSHMANLRELNLGVNIIAAEGAQAIASSPHMANLRKLNLSNNQIGDAGVQSITTSPYMANLTELNLWGNIIHDAGAQTIATSPHMVNLTDLNLRDNLIHDAGAQSIATSPYMAHLRKLNLWDNGIGHIGAQAIATSIYMAHLRKLNLGLNKIGAEGAQSI